MLNDNDQPPRSIDHVHDDQAELHDERSYECTYCKHGFTNAQALGGHMNVHRKERAKISLDSTHKSSTRPYEPCLITSWIHDHKQEIKTQEFMLRSSPMIFDNNVSKYQNPNALITSSSREEMRLSLSLSLQFDQSYEDESIQGGKEDDEVDLELRLGQDQWKCS